MKRFILIFSCLWIMCFSAHSQAVGYNGLTYEFYRGTGPTPSLNPLAYPTVIKTGVSPTINYSGSWGGTNSVLDTGYWDRFIVRWYGYINIPTGGTYTFGGNSDDGLIIKINNTTVVNAWYDSGGAFKQGTPITLAAGVVPVEVWYYENGGGQAVNFQWNLNNTWQIVGNTYLATDATFWAPQPATLCCGGSSAAFSANAAHQTAVETFVNRTTADSQVYVDQIGNSNNITIEQTGTKNNYVNYVGNGSYNDVTVTQGGNNNTQVNYVDLKITGNANTVNLSQQSTGGGKGIFATINDNNNNVTVQQKDNGSHYLNLTLSGGNKNVDITQQGSASHMANVTLSGTQTGLSLTQSGSTQQFYSINHNCATAGGCGTITVQQGQ